MATGGSTLAGDSSDSDGSDQLGLDLGDGSRHPPPPPPPHRFI